MTTVGTQTILDTTSDTGVGLRYRSDQSASTPIRESAPSGYVAVKTAGEWLIALMLVIVTSPLMLVLALAVKLTSSGPAFYAQTRLGKFGRHYRILKLRTMRNNAEAHTGPVWASQDDVRITKIGRILRDTHLDELPQLWNVLRGEMGLIGPRPERPELAARLERQMPQFSERLKVRPGITGLAQMLVPADDPSDPMLRVSRMKLSNDLLYVRKMSFLLDTRIAFSTFCYFFSAGISSIGRSSIRKYGRHAVDQYKVGLSRERAVDVEKAAV